MCVRVRVCVGVRAYPMCACVYLCTRVCVCVSTSVRVRVRVEIRAYPMCVCACVRVCVGVCFMIHIYQAYLRDRLEFICRVSGESRHGVDHPIGNKRKARSVFG